MVNLLLRLFHSKINKAVAAGVGALVAFLVSKGVPAPNDPQLLVDVVSAFIVGGLTWAIPNKAD